jgi:hypothetical protein
MIYNEGGFKLIDIAADRGGQTYAGIARNFHPNWPGWHCIDSKGICLVSAAALRELAKWLELKWYFAKCK